MWFQFQHSLRPVAPHTPFAFLSSPLPGSSVLRRKCQEVPGVSESELQAATSDNQSEQQVDVSALAFLECSFQ
eukprot:11138223-Alexandrium_andersonii.AAC.1